MGGAVEMDEPSISKQSEPGVVLPAGEDQGHLMRNPRISALHGLAYPEI